MRIAAASLIALVFLSPDIARADVRIDEHALHPILHSASHAALPDLLAELLPPAPDRTRLFSMPADGRVSSLFGWRIDPILGARRFHAGIDLANLRSSRVVAAGAGIVRAAGPAANCGLAVCIVHGDGWESRSCHLERVAVRRGERVAAGQTIGFMGATGRATGPHLHFELARGGASVDPAMWLLW